LALAALEDLGVLDELAQQVRELPEEELLRIATTERAQYVPEALALVQSEIQRRGLENISSAHHLKLKREREQMEERERPRAARWLSWMYQTVSSEASALRVTRQGAIASWVIGAGTFVLAVSSATVETVPSLKQAFYNLLGAVIYIAIGFGTWGGSLLAAGFGLAVYVGDRLYAWVVLDHEPGGIAILLTMAFLNGVRGARALRSFRSSSALASVEANSSGGA
jgi:hypothetical protein